MVEQVLFEFKMFEHVRRLKPLRSVEHLVPVLVAHLTTIRAVVNTQIPARLSKAHPVPITNLTAIVAFVLH